MARDRKPSTAGPWPHQRLWGFVKSLHPVQLAGFSIGMFELMAFFAAGRPIDKEVMPFAAAMILWQSLKNRAEKRGEKP